MPLVFWASSKWGSKTLISIFIYSFKVQLYEVLMMIQRLTYSEQCSDNSYFEETESLLTGNLKLKIYLEQGHQRSKPFTTYNNSKPPKDVIEV